MQRCDYGRNQSVGDGVVWTEEGCRVASPNWNVFLIATVTLQVSVFPLWACRKWGGGAGALRRCDDSGNHMSDDGAASRGMSCGIAGLRQARRLKTQTRQRSAEWSRRVEPQRAEGV
jgi:hypothetical protein